ncbi:MAG TPA: ABC transporter permease [Dehalococcoidia bacterium]|nr:ABC transporter permease [Dehalococcoidia bacterium]
MDQILTAAGVPLREDRRNVAGSVARGVLRFVRRKPLGAVGGAFVLLMLFCALFADRQVVTAFQDHTPLLAPHYFDDQNLRDRLQGPSLAHPFGTDGLGRDQLSQIIYGARVSLIVGLGAVFLAIALATAVGVVSGYVGGRFDMAVQRFVDSWIAFPAIVILISAIQVAKAYIGDSAEAQTFAVILVLGVVLAAGASRVIRSSAIAIKGNLYVEAARTIGATETRIVLRYILPNVMAVIIVLATLQLGAAILAEATVSFLGFGIPPPFPSWGRMLSTDGLLLMRRDPWLAFWPGFAIFLVVFGFNVLGDALRDVLDPRLRGGR